MQGLLPPAPASRRRRTTATAAALPRRRMPCFLLLLLLVLAAALPPAHAQPPPTVIQIGDSWTELSAQSLATFCSGATVVNRGVSSSTALEWASGSSCPAGGGSTCSMADAFSSAHGSGYTHAIVSIGGNDFLDTQGCGMSAAELASRVTSVVNALRAAAPAGIQIILVGYCTPTGPYADCATPALVANLNSGIAAAAAAAADVTYIDGTAACGGSTSAFSPGTYHIDPIHLNSKGYCNVYTMPAMQAALGCAAAAYDCAIPARIDSGGATASASALGGSSSASSSQGSADMHASYSAFVPSDLSGAAAGIQRRSDAAERAAREALSELQPRLGAISPFLPPPPETTRSSYESATVSPVFGQTSVCYNSSHCPFPSLCTLESSQRRYCSSTRFASTPGRTLFLQDGLQQPGRHGCDRCAAPLALVDFGDAGEVGANACEARCDLPNNSSSPDAVAESYLTSNCLVACAFAPATLYGDAALSASAHFPGADHGTVHLEAARAAEAQAAAAANRAEDEHANAMARANARREADMVTAERRRVLHAVITEAESQQSVALYVLDKARHAARTASAIEQRQADGALVEAMRLADEATAALASARADLTAFEAAQPFVPATEAEAPFATAATSYLAAQAATAHAEAIANLTTTAGLRSLPLPPSLASVWQRDDGWGGAVTASPAGGLLKLTEATLGRSRRQGQAGWFQLDPGRPLHAFRCEMDLLIGGGDGGDGFALSYAPPNVAAMKAAVGEARGPHAAPPQPEEERAQAQARQEERATVSSSGAILMGGTGSSGGGGGSGGGGSGGGGGGSGGGSNNSSGNASAASMAAAVVAAIAAANATSGAATSSGVHRAAPRVLAASASGGLGAHVFRGPTEFATPGEGLSVALRTQPEHAVEVWFNGSLLARAPYVGCPHAPSGTFGGSCSACAVCPGCPPCVPCSTQQECPLRPGRRFVRFAVQLHAPTASLPPRVEAWHAGVPLLRSPVPVPGMESLAHWALILSASTSPDHDDDHWVDNLRLAAPPSKPVPPALVNATLNTIALAWFAPHHGGADVTLFRLQRRGARGWVTSYVGNGTQRIVGPLKEATQYLFRVQAYNSIGWGVRRREALDALDARTQSPTQPSPPGAPFDPLDPYPRLLPPILSTHLTPIPACFPRSFRPT